MDIMETLDIMNSDHKLWQRAESKELGGGKVEKTLDLPWGIGPVSVTLEGMTDASKKREAVGAYANYIRGIIREARDDEAITSRAKAAAAQRKQVDSADSDSVDPDQGLRDTPSEAEAVQGASGPHPPAAEADADLGETLTARRSALKERIGRVETDLARWKKELRGIEAALAAMEDD